MYGIVTVCAFMLGCWNTAQWDGVSSCGLRLGLGWLTVSQMSVQAMLLYVEPQCYIRSMKARELRSKGHIADNPADGCSSFLHLPHVHNVQVPRNITLVFQSVCGFLLWCSCGLYDVFIWNDVWATSQELSHCSVDMLLWLDLCAPAELAVCMLHCTAGSPVGVVALPNWSLYH